MQFGSRIAAAVLFTLAGLAAAQAAEKPAPKSIWEQDTLTGDWGGARSSLHDKGIDITLNYINEVLGVMSGGLARRTSYEGRFEFSVDSDLEKLIGWNSATTHVTVYNIHSTARNAAMNVGSIADPSNIDALQTTRLFTAWFQQNWANDKVSLRIGQLAADDEFITSPTAGGLINGTFGWASILAANILSGGPAYPLATPGVRLAIKPTDELTFMTALFSGDPAGERNCAGQPQICNRNGLTFSTAHGALWMNELQYGVNQTKNATGLPAVYKLGFWYVNFNYPDILTPTNHANNWGIYGVADQTVWKSAASALSLFVRAGAVPSNRNLVSSYIDGGVGIKGPLPGRADDQLTLGVAYQNISHDTQLADIAGGLVPRNYETVIELSYLAQLAPWWTLQPDLQYIVHPSGGQNPVTPTAVLKNAVVLGLRSTIKF